MGQVLGQVGELPDVYSELEINFFLLRRLLGVRSSQASWQNLMRAPSKRLQKTCRARCWNRANWVAKASCLLMYWCAPRWQQVSAKRATSYRRAPCS